MSGAFRPLLPQFGSGTRTFFLQWLRLTDSANYTTNNCVSDRNSTNPAVELLENTGNLLTDPLAGAVLDCALFGAVCRDDR